MTKVVRLRKGLNIYLKGRAAKRKLSLEVPEEYALVPDDFVGVVPKVVVKEGDSVEAGDALFVNKNCPDVKFASPVSGTVSEVVRGERRKVLYIKVKADAEQKFRDFGKKDVASLSGEEVKRTLLEAGLFGYINQLPYAVSTTPDTEPKAIFVSALRDMPLAGEFEYEIVGQEDDFQTGITALSRIAKVHLGMGWMQSPSALDDVRDAEITVYDGPCPTGNVGVQVNYKSPVNKGEVVWTVDPTAVLFFGRLFRTGHVDLTRSVALGGSEVKDAAYVDLKVGASLDGLIRKYVNNTRKVRVINGNPFTGKPLDRPFSEHAWLGAHTSEIVTMPEGDDCNEFVGWLMPRFSQFSVSRSYFSWLRGCGTEYVLDARVKGGRRNIIMSGEYDKVIPMDIYGEYLIKAIIAGDIDKQEQLGIYEVSPEDFAVAEFVDSSKLELQRIVRQGLDILRKENA